MQEDKADDRMQSAKDDGSAEARVEQSGGHSARELKTANVRCQSPTIRRLASASVDMAQMV